MNPATFIFLLTYVLVSLGENSPRKLDRPTATLLGAVLMVVSGSLSRGEAYRAIDFGTLAILFGLMILLTVLMQSGLPTWLAFRVLNRCSSPRELLAVVVFTSGLGSALMLNDTVCLLGTPLLLQMTTQAGLRPAPFLLALATSANIGSVMTLTGNPQNIIIGEASGWTWAGFALHMVPIGLVALAADWLLLSLIYRRSLQPAMMQCQLTDLKNSVQYPLAAKSVFIFGGLISAFLLGAPLDVSSVSAAALLLVWANRPPREALEKVDWSLLLFFAGLFVVVAGFVKAEGYLLGRWIDYLGTQVGLKTIALFSTATVLGSNLVSNVPLVIIVSHWVRQMSDPMFVWLLLALTSTFAGNLTLFGSVANVIVAQGAQHHAPLRFRDFLLAGIPVTLVTTILGVSLLWVFRRLGF
ncbi:MAG: SLC13 family permease [Deltaproteobacteria bacterium]|nr:SLC13 family permease [Deltaproteobacteria bacterium]